MPRHKADDTELIAATLALMRRAGRFNARTRRWAIEEIAEEFASTRNCEPKTLRDRLHRVLPRDEDELRLGGVAEQDRAETVQPVRTETAVITSVAAEPIALIISKELEELRRRVSDLEEGPPVVDDGHY